jgi:dihydroorotate dehydrogenase (NAD+) catalytic subunit
MTIDRKRRAPTLTNVSGGLSGPAIKPYALHLVYNVAQEVSVPVIGLGGILTWEDAADFILAGATAVQVGTALMVDPTAWRPILDGLERWLAREGVRQLSEVVGAANPGYKRKAGEVSLAGR